VKYTELIVEIKEGIAFISINREEKGNALSSLAIGELIDFFSKTASDVGARVAIIKGAGNKFFCSGSDIGELFNNDISEQRESFSRLVLFYETIRRSPIISIAAVNGLALGTGCGLVAVSDIAIAQKTARFALPEIKLGVAPLIALLPVMRSIGIKKSFLMAVMGKFITADEAYEIGLISSTAKDEKLNDEAKHIASDLIEKSGIILSLIKRGIQEAEGFNHLRSYEYLKELITYSMFTEDLKEGITAFLEKRQPVWKHR